MVDWNDGPTAPANVSFARQNLPLIVNEGRAEPEHRQRRRMGRHGRQRGARLALRDRRRRHGNLIYAAGEDQTVASLAKTLIHAGAVRAMELDINSYWVSFITYGAPGAEEPTNLLPGHEPLGTRYLEPDDRDFFAVYSR